MIFCPNCGTQLQDGTVACPNCGTFVNGQPQQPQQPQYNPYNNVPMGYVKPKIPGRGAGIAGMVLAIIGLVYSFYCFLLAVSVSEGLSQTETYYGGYYGYSEVESAIGAGFTIAIIFFSVLSILGVSLAGSGRSKGYRNGISMSGVIMGIIGLIIYLISIIIVMAA